MPWSARAVLVVAAAGVLFDVPAEACPIVELPLSEATLRADLIALVVPAGVSGDADDDAPVALELVEAWKGSHAGPLWASPGEACPAGEDGRPQPMLVFLAQAAADVE